MYYLFLLPLPPCWILVPFVVLYLAPRAVSITYIEANGTEKTVDAPVGMNLLDVAHENNIELEGKQVDG